MNFWRIWKKKFSRNFQFHRRDRKSNFEGESWGIELCGEGPTEIRRVRAGGPADYAGLQAGDIVLMANGINVTRFGHQEIDLHSLHQKIIGETQSGRC